MSRSDLIHEETETLRKSKESCTIIAANGTITTTEETILHVTHWEMLLTVQLLQDSPDLLTLVKLGEEHGVFLRMEGKHYPR